VIVSIFCDAFLHILRAYCQEKVFCKVSYFISQLDFNVTPPFFHFISRIINLYRIPITTNSALEGETYLEIPNRLSRSWILIHSIKLATAWSPWPCLHKKAFPLCSLNGRLHLSWLTPNRLRDASERTKVNGYQAFYKNKKPKKTFC